MRASYTPEQAELERTMLAVGKDGLAAARVCLSGPWVAPAADERLVADYAGLGVAESAGGVGGSLVDLSIVVAALARTLTPTRLVGQVAAIQVGHAAGLDVSAAAAGRQRWCLAVGGSGAAVAGGAAVVGGADADVAVVVDDAGQVARVDVVAATARPGIDATRPFARLTLAHPVEATGDVADGVLRATVVAAADLAGAARGAVELGAAYARGRHQFGRAIGALQGVAFALADAVVAATAAWDLTLYAAWATDSGAPDAAAAVHAAKAKAGQAALFAAERTTQVFGGMGITAEADPHLYLRRALAGDAWLGTGRWHRAQLGLSRLRR